MTKQAVTMSHDNYRDDDIRAILAAVRSIAVVGASPREVRPSYLVMKFLIGKGYRILPVNPGLAGGSILGRTVYADLRSITEPVDMVDIFRNSDAASVVVDEALDLKPLPRVIWMQLGVRNDEAAKRAEAAGVRVIMNRCPKIEYGRLSGEIAWLGVNTARISSRRPVVRDGFQSLGIRFSDARD